jgi:outer membrane protein assembly factor BamB
MRYKKTIVKRVFTVAIIIGGLWPIEIAKPDLVHGHNDHNNVDSSNEKTRIPINDYGPNETENDGNIFLPLVMTRGDEIPPGDDNPWSMAGANPERTSWTPEEVKGPYNPLWYRKFEPFILPRVQIVAANDSLYISTARGLYALDAKTGADKWVYATELPLGHSPTVDQGVVYVGGFDRKLHAIDAFTGRGLWAFEAGAGFDTNPLVVDGIVYAGNRDGYFYAVFSEGANAGKLAWKYPTGGPIHFSAAHKDGVVYFASDDSHAYALNAKNGSLVWKSSKLPGAGFHSWWPVVYQDLVIFPGSANYPNSMFQYSEVEVYPNREDDPRGTLIGPLSTEPGSWVNGTPTIDTSKPTVTQNGSTLPITEYFEGKPWRRTYFVLDRETGQEVTYDFDDDGKLEYAPILWQGTDSGNRFPPVVGGDGIIYQANNYMSNPGIPGGQISGWKIGTPFINVISMVWNAVDEPLAYSAGGNLIYWNLCCDRQAGATDIAKPNQLFADNYNSRVRPPTGSIDLSREWFLFSYGQKLADKLPGYDEMVYRAAFGGPNGIYWYHGDQNPPIPYKGKIYMHRSNAIIAFSDQNSQPVELPLATIANGQGISSESVESSEITNLLAAEVQKILGAGHLRPGYSSTGAFDFFAQQYCGDDLVDYWHHPADIIYALLIALPYLPTDLQQETMSYIQTEFDNYPPYQYNHIGQKDGFAREVFDLPPEVEAIMANSPPEESIIGFEGWEFNPYAFYVLWKYGLVFGGAQDIFDASRDRLESVPSNDVLIEMPFVHNAYIAGYFGYLELEKLAGYPESTDIKAELERLLTGRAETFSKESPYSDLEWQSNKNYCRSINVSRNFMYLTPELGQYLHDRALGKVQEALDEYYQIAPYWFVSKVEATFGEGTIHHLYDNQAVFQAKAKILKESPEELFKYLDVSAMERGDLFYIQNLVAILEAGGANSLKSYSDCY